MTTPCVKHLTSQVNDHRWSWLVHTPKLITSLPYQTHICCVSRWSTMNGVDAMSTEQITSTRCVEGFDVGYCSIDEGTRCGVVLVEVTNHY